MDAPKPEEPKRGSAEQQVYGLVADVLFLPGMLLGGYFYDSRSMVAVGMVAVLASFGCRVMSIRATPDLSPRARWGLGMVWGAMAASFLGFLSWLVSR